MTTPSPEPANTRNPLFLILGLVVLGIVFALVLFGGDLFGTDEPDPAIQPITDVIDATPEFDEPSTPVVAEIPSGTEGAPEVGAPAPDFSLVNLEGDMVSLSDYRGQPVIVNFWATWCAPCRIEMPEFQATIEERADDGLVILALNREEDATAVTTYFNELELTFTPLLDEQAIVANLYNVFNMPTTYFVNEEGVVTAIHRGPLVKEQLDGYLAETISSN